MGLEKQTKKPNTTQPEQQATGISKHSNLSTELWDERTKHYRILNITTAHRNFIVAPPHLPNLMPRNVLQCLSQIDHAEVEKTGYIKEYDGSARECEVNNEDDCAILSGKVFHRRKGP